MDFISIIMSAGKTSVDVALYTLLPIMVVMLIVMKYLEVRGVLDVIVRWLAPLLKPFGLTICVDSDEFCQLCRPAGDPRHYG